MEPAPDIPISKDAEPGRVLLEAVEALGRDAALARVAAVCRDPGHARVLCRTLACPQPVVDRHQAAGQGALVKLDLVEDFPGPEPCVVVEVQVSNELGYAFGMVDLSGRKITPVDLGVAQQLLQLRGRQLAETGMQPLGLARHGGRFRAQRRSMPR